jgi:DNA-binding PadR family transcriptional regulator
MDVRTICLAILTRGDATGYEIKKLFEDGGYRHVVEASFGSIYPALNRLTEEGLVTMRTAAQEGRPDRKVYSLTEAGRRAVTIKLAEPLSEDRHRSPFLFAMLFSHLLPEEHVLAMIDHYISQSETQGVRLSQAATNAKTHGEHFVTGFGRAVNQAILTFLREHRRDFEYQAAEAAE